MMDEVTVSRRYLWSFRAIEKKIRKGEYLSPIPRELRPLIKVNEINTSFQSTDILLLLSYFNLVIMFLLCKSTAGLTSSRREGPRLQPNQFWFTSIIGISGTRTDGGCIIQSDIIWILLVLLGRRLAPGWRRQTGKNCSVRSIQTTRLVKTDPRGLD